MVCIRRIAMMLIVALLAAGCDVRWEWKEKGAGSLYGYAAVRYDGFPLAGAEVRLDGPVRRQTTTSRSGAFRLVGLPEGQYKATLQALHGSYSASVWVGGAETLSWRVEPSGFDRDLFYALSGLKQYYVDGSGRLVWDYGQLVRWEQSAVQVYMDVAAAPYGFDPTWPDRYWQEIRRWEDMLRGRVSFRRVYDAASADIVLIWQPRGFLGDHAGIARHLAYYQNGAIKRVLIEIDVGYGGRPGLFAHEFAHGMGVDHATEPSSVMYPWMESGRRTTFSQRERAHVRLMYDVPSGQRLAKGYAVTLASIEAQDDGESEGAAGGRDNGVGDSTLTDDPVTGYRGHVTSLGGFHEALDDDEAAWLMDGRTKY